MNVALRNSGKKRSPRRGAGVSRRGSRPRRRAARGGVERTSEQCQRESRLRLIVHRRSACRQYAVWKAPSRKISDVNPTLLRGVAVWLALMSAEFVHGIARAVWLVPVVGDWRSRQIGVFTGSVINVVITALFVRWIHPRRASEAVLIGVMWVALTVMFEILFGRFVIQASWQRLGSDYDVIHGGLLPLGLIVLAIAPVVTGTLRRVFQ